MRIGIITLPLHKNYGGTLQNFALHTVLIKFGYTPITLKYNSIKRHEKLRLFLSFIYHGIKRSGIYQDIVNFFRKDYYEQKFRMFEERYINIKNVGYGTVDGKKVTKLNLDALIVGSDQTWRPLYNGEKRLDNMFLDFADEKTIKISYGASFGKDDLDEFSKEQLIRYSKLLQRFDSISVREESGVALCNDYFGVNASHVLDPTMLVREDVYSKLGISPGKKNYAAIYILDNNESKDRIINEICKKYKLDKLFIGKPDDQGVYPSIESWIGGLKESDFVITDSFHGTVFSILFERPFITICNPVRGLSRIHSLHHSFQIEGRIFGENEAIPETFKIIDWKHVHNVLERRRKEGIEYLLRALSAKDV